MFDGFFFELFATGSLPNTRLLPSQRRTNSGIGVGDKAKLFFCLLVAIFDLCFGGWVRAKG